MLRVLPPRSQTHLATYQVVVSCVTTDFWLDKITRDSRHTGELRHLLQNRFASAGKKCNMYTLLKNKELLSTFCQNFSELEITSYVAREVRFLGGNMSNIAFQLTLHQSSKTSSTFLLPVSMYLYDYGNHNTVSSKERRLFAFGFSNSSCGHSEGSF